MIYKKKKTLTQKVMLKIKSQRKKLKKFLMIILIKIKMLLFKNLNKKQNKILMRSYFKKTNQNKLNKTN